MEDVIFEVARRDDYQGLAEWLVQMSQAPEQRCLHTWSGQNAKELQQQLSSYCDESELCYVMALRDGQPVGAMGSEYDEGLERGWLHGPHVAMGDWELIARELFTRLLAALPACIGQLDAYLDAENARGRRFYAQQGFKEREHRGIECRGGYLCTAEMRRTACSALGFSWVEGTEEKGMRRRLFGFCRDTDSGSVDIRSATRPAHIRMKGQSRYTKSLGL